MKIVFIGNSIVNGFPWKRSESFPGLVRDKLNSTEFRGRITGGMNMKFEVINKGINGDTTEGILQRLDHDALSHRPDRVYVLTGTNDFIYGEAGEEGVLSNVKEIVRRCLQRGIKPVLMTPLPLNPPQAAECWLAGGGVDYEIIQEALGLVSQRFLDYGEAEGIEVIDTNSQYRNCFQYHDGIHPTQEGQKLIAQLIVSQIESELKG